MAKTTRTITAEQILASLSTKAPTGNTLTDTLVDGAADAIDATVSFGARLGGAFVEAGHNAKAHYQIERGVQRMKSDARLKLAAERAAQRINEYLA